MAIFQIQRRVRKHGLVPAPRTPITAPLRPIGHSFLRRVLLGFAGLSMLSCVNLAQCATLVFADDFEAGTWNSAWSLDTGYATLPQVLASALDGGPGPKSGGKMLALNWNGNVAWNDSRNRSGLVLRNWNY